MKNVKEFIDSIKDEKVVEARSLLTSKGRRCSGKFLLEGEEAIQWALNSPCTLSYVFVHDKLLDHPLLETLRERGVPFYFASDGILKKISDTSYLIPLIGVTLFPKTQPVKENILVVLDRVKDLGNIGTIVRTASAFGICDFASTEEDFDFFYKKTIDASRGRVFHSSLTTFCSGRETVEQLKAQGYQVVATTSQASIIHSFASLAAKPIAVVFGNETDGISQEVLDAADARIHIPMSGLVESLNVGVAAGISLYELKVKWTLSMLTKMIHESLGRHLYCTSRWSRLVFDTFLRQSTPFNADQAILMMILKCDGTSDRHNAACDAAITRDINIDELIFPLLRDGYLLEQQGQLSLSRKGEEALAKIWPIHEEIERQMLNNISQDELTAFTKVLGKICNNCEKVTPFR